ncbi:MAG: cell division protein FtsK, partial [Proteobacteria bacterium]|nr:cell division protein FtsK [Pseudomonadota bacterium]
MIPNYVKNTLLNFLSFFLIAFSLYILIALISHDPSDPGIFYKTSSSNINNLGGPLGANISDFLFTIFGLGSYLILAVGVIWALQTIFFRDPYNSKVKIAVRVVSSVILLISFCSILEYYFLENSGGYLGKIFFINLSNTLGFIGSLIFLVIFIIPASSLSFNFSWLKTLDLIGNLLINFFDLCRVSLSKLFSFIRASTSSFFKRLKEIRDIKESKKEEAKNLKSKIVSAKKVDIAEDKNKSLD